MNYLHVLIQIGNQSSLNRKKRLGGGSGSQIQINTGQLQFGCFDFSVLKTVIFHIQQNQFPAGLQDSFCVLFLCSINALKPQLYRQHFISWKLTVFCCFSFLTTCCLSHSISSNNGVEMWVVSSTSMILPFLFFPYDIPN